MSPPSAVATRRPQLLPHVLRVLLVVLVPAVAVVRPAAAPSRAPRRRLATPPVSSVASASASVAPARHAPVTTAAVVAPVAAAALDAALVPGSGGARCVVRSHGRARRQELSLLFAPRQRWDDDHICSTRTHLCSALAFLGVLVAEHELELAHERHVLRLQRLQLLFDASALRRTLHPARTLRGRNARVSLSAKRTKDGSVPSLRVGARAQRCAARPCHAPMPPGRRGT